MTGEESLPAVDELLGLLGNETRMSIVRTLWENFDFGAYVTEARDGMEYSTLLETADTDDSGNFNYHLRQLDGVLVANREDAYVLTPLGYNLMRSIDRYEGFEYETVDEWVIDDPCPYCEGDLVAGYSREVLSVRCRDCGGLASGGNFTFVQVPATGGGRLGTSELLDAAALAMFERVKSAGHGICWDCRAHMDAATEVCDAHDPGPDGICTGCDLRYRTNVIATCSNCGNEGRGPAVEYAVVSPVVAAFFERFDRGPDAVGPWRYRLAALGAVTESVTATDSVTAELAFDRGDATCRVTVEATAGGVRVESEAPVPR